MFSSCKKISLISLVTSCFSKSPFFAYLFLGKIPSNIKLWWYNIFMSGRQISLIYFYLVSAGALALLVIGIFNSVNFIINATQYKEYPLRYQQDCDSIYPMPVKVAPRPIEVLPEPASQSAEEAEKQRRLCQSNLEKQRKQQMLDDLRNSITFTLVGAILFLIHFPIARSQSKDPKNL